MTEKKDEQHHKGKEAEEACTTSHHNKDSYPGSAESEVSESSPTNDNIEKILEDHPKLGDLVDDDPDVKEQLSIIIEESRFSGPIPHPDILKGYNEAQEGSADRIMTMAEKDAEHIREMQRRVLSAKKTEVILGQIFGFVIGVVALLCGTWIVISGYPIVGGIIGSGGVIGLVSAFILGRSKKEVRKKDQE